MVKVINLIDTIYHNFLFDCNYNDDNLERLTMSQAISSLLFTFIIRLQLTSRPCIICAGHSGKLASSSTSNSSCPCHCHSTETSHSFFLVSRQPTDRMSLLNTFVAVPKAAVSTKVCVFSDMCQLSGGVRYPTFRLHDITTQR